MLYSLFLYIPPTIALFVAVYAFFNIRKSLTIKSKNCPFPSSTLALVEKDLERLKAVHVICHHIETPTKNFRSAVIDNLQEGVKYFFYIPHDDADREAKNKSFTDYFQSCINIAKTEAPNSDIDFQSLFSICFLNMKWDDYPYIYYEYLIDESEECSSRIIAFRGTKKNVGISPQYLPLGHEIAATIANTVGLQIGDSISFANSNEAKNVVYLTQVKQTSTARKANAA